MCIMAAGSWEPVVAGEYLMSEWILSLGRSSIVCILTGALFCCPTAVRGSRSRLKGALSERQRQICLENYSCTTFNSGTAHKIAHFKE